MVAIGKKLAPAAKATPVAVMLMATWFESIDVQLATPGSLLTQPFTPCGTNTSVPGSRLEQVVSVHARVNVMVPFNVAATGDGMPPTVLLVLVIVMAMFFSCPTAKPGGQLVPALGNIGIEPLAWQPPA